MKRNRKYGKCQKEGQTRVKPLSAWQKRSKNSKAKMTRLVERVTKFSSSPGAPHIALVYVEQSQFRAVGTKSLCQALKGKLKLSDIEKPTDSGNDTPVRVVDAKNIDLSIEWNTVGVRILRAAYTRLAPRPLNQKKPRYEEHLKPEYWPQCVPFVSHSKKKEDGSGRLLTVKLLRTVLQVFCEYCLKKKEEGWTVVNEAQAPKSEENNPNESREGRRKRKAEKESTNEDREEKEEETREEKTKRKMDEDDGKKESTEQEDDQAKKGEQETSEDGKKENREKEEDQAKKGEQEETRENRKKENTQEEEDQAKKREEQRFVDQFLKTSGFSTRAFWSRNQRIVVGQEILERKDLDTLKGSNWLVDRVLNAYMSVLQQENNLSSKDHIFVFQSYIAAIWDSQQRQNLIYSKVKLAAFTWLFMPINVNENHWVLLAANVPAMEMSVLHSLGGSHPSIHKSWRKYMRARSQMVEPQNNLAGRWKEGRIKSSLQDDYNNCGPFVLMNALALTKGFYPDCLTTKTAMNMRQYVLEKLIGHSKAYNPRKNLCDMPDCQRPKGDKNVSCDCCGRWCHFKCVDLRKRKDDGFICPICEAIYS